MIFGLGVDICENYRIKSILDKHEKSFLSRIFIPEEIEYCMEKKNPVPHLAARFALKEAFIKAIGFGTFGSYKEIGLVGSSGKKDPVVFGNMKEQITSLQITNIHCSISHADNYSTAMVVLEK